MDDMEMMIIEREREQEERDFILFWESSPMQTITLTDHKPATMANTVPDDSWCIELIHSSQMINHNKSTMS